MAKRFSYKDFIDGIAVHAPRHVSQKTINMVWKEAVKYILRELQHNGEIYVPYIGYLKIVESNEKRIPTLKGRNTKLKVSKVDYVEFKPFKVFLDFLNLIDTDDEKKLNRLIKRTHIDEIDFIPQDYDEYIEEYVEPYYTDTELETTKAVVEGLKTEDSILEEMANSTYRRNYSPRKNAMNRTYVKYQLGDNPPVIEKTSKAVKILGISKFRVYDYYWKNCNKCWDDDIEMDFTDVNTELKIWMLGTEEQARKKGEI